MDLLETIAELSHEFGGPEYVLGGGGNSSAKDDATLWVKPSGVTLLDLRPGDGGVQVPAREELEQRAATIEQRFGALGLPARKWLRMVRPYQARAEAR